jgi:hypothetical protein
VSGRRKPQVNEVPIDKVESFMYANYKKILIATAVVLVGFVVVYTISQVLSVNAEKSISRVAAAEASLNANSSAADVAAFKNLAASNSAVKDYIYYKSGVVESFSNKTEAVKTLGMAGGKFKEFADGLAFDLGNKEISPSSYISKGELKALWYYRAVLAAEGDEKAKLLADFGAKYPESELYELVKKWES